MIKIFKKIKKIGFVGCFRLAIIKALGIASQQKEIDTLYYFLKNYIDVRNFPPTKDVNLRNLQIGDLVLLKIIDKILTQNNLTYWLDAGTALGAVRHKGFIPWDDDVDIAMPREDYAKAVKVLKNELLPLGIDVDEDYPMGRIGVGYKHKQTGIWCDIFSYDTISTNLHFSEVYRVYTPIIEKYKKYCKRNLLNNIDSVKKKHDEVFSEKGINKFLVHGYEFPHVVKPSFFYKDWILPVRRIKFENAELPVPNNYDSYLKELFTKDYMSLPKTGVEHHGDERGGIKNWAEYSGTNMETIIKELEMIFRNL